ncbi:MAG TPA: hypothetical protein V6D17_19090 [Candidatus Obscuribacterales bacterium]
MAKPSANGKVRTRTVVKTPKGAGQFPVNTQESNAVGDRKARQLFLAILIASFVLVAGGVAWIGWQLTVLLGKTPIDWVGVGLGVVALALTFFIGRGLAWFSFFSAIMYASRVKAWESQEALCRSAIKFGKFFPGGAATASLMLIQSLVSRGQTAEAIKVGEELWERLGGNPKHDQTLAPMCSMLGLAHQVSGEPRPSIVWNERAIESFTRVLEDVERPKGLMTKLAVKQSPNLAGSVHMQLAVSYFNNATSHFQQMNYRPAKESFKKAVEHANQAPDSQEKVEVLKASKEQLNRLKHH